MTATTSERVTEEQIASLEADFLRLQRALVDAKEAMERVYKGIGTLPPPVGVPQLTDELAEAERKLLTARAALERQRREEVEAHAAAMLAANQDMAKASSAAATSSGASARAAERAARWTMVAAFVAAAGTAVTAWLGIRR